LKPGTTSSTASSTTKKSSLASRRNLRGNNRPVTVNSRFFIYRVAFPDALRTMATLTCVQDPLRHASALARELSIDIDEVADRTTFKVISKEALQPA
ncbi:hypothetical protein, partial [Sinorhizobium meliloti]|uniref:hypothetical protein n=1 Tax=Rhizobium meliloti TaxID=382 RepID=UPI001AECA9CB